VSDSQPDVRAARITRGIGGERRLECPECGQGLPFDQWTECDRCGAHLELKVEVVAPGLD
jgi:uncharacterized protein (DUF983 family)